MPTPNDYGWDDARLRERKTLGVRQGDALALKDCHGVLVPAPEKRICPDHGVLVAMVSLPDSIGTRRFVQVLLMAADSLSKSALVLGYVMEPRGSLGTCKPTAPGRTAIAHIL
jgi:hypothetical protein